MTQMTPHERKRTLRDENARLVHDWLMILDEDKQRLLISSLLELYSQPQLLVMKAHVAAQLEKAQERTP